jgi:hypothetical protein
LAQPLLADSRNCLTGDIGAGANGGDGRNWETGSTGRGAILGDGRDSGDGRYLGKGRWWCGTYDTAGKGSGAQLSARPFTV